MTFIGKGIVWDAIKKKALCRFGMNGLLDTTDSYIITRLKELGYAEANSTEMVSVYECNSVNVDWKERYDIEHDIVMQLRRELASYKADVKADVKAPVQATPEVVVEDKEPVTDEIECYTIDGVEIPVHYEDLGVFKLKALLRAVDGLQGNEYKKVTKDFAIKLMADFLLSKGY
jgi:hypothetical protein